MLACLQVRWPHELSAGWFTPLDAAFPTLAEYLGARAAMPRPVLPPTLAYCSSDSGLARGFATYRDFIFPDFTALHLTALVGRIVDGIQGIESVCTRRLAGRRSPEVAGRSRLAALRQSRKDAAVVNREFLDWLSARRRPDRPFFAFLNFYDAHFPMICRPRASIDSGRCRATSVKRPSSAIGLRSRNAAYRRADRSLPVTLTTTASPILTSNLVS